MSVDEPEVPFPFAGWLEEHPDGGFALFAEDGSFVVVTSYDGLRQYLSAGSRVVHAVRIRHAMSNAESPERRLELARERLQKRLPAEDER